MKYCDHNDIYHVNKIKLYIFVFTHNKDNFKDKTVILIYFKDM